MPRIIPVDHNPFDTTEPYPNNAIDRREYWRNKVEVDRQIQTAGQGSPYESGGGGTLMTEDQIKEVFGKDMAGKIIEGSKKENGTVIEDLPFDSLMGASERWIDKALTKQVELRPLSIDITPKIRDAVKQGQALFANQGAAPIGSDDRGQQEPKLVPVDHDPFTPTMTPVEHDPFAAVP